MGAPPARAQPNVGDSATDDNAADARAKPRVCDRTRTTGPSVCRVFAERWPGGLNTPGGRPVRN
ncbi:hypothetical protein GCM10010270_18160 [Streptomyces violaceus]|nr:hypothetical protein GCM10010270_18160 [Streptomyces janthinus]